MISVIGYEDLQKLRDMLRTKIKNLKGTVYFNRSYYLKDEIKRYENTLKTVLTLLDVVEENKPEIL